MAVLSKVRADYHITKYPAGTINRQCKDCDMFRAPDRCTLVRGDIDPQATCKFWERKKG